jgi:N-acetylmuramoyl-L-alanine amidase
VLAFVAGTAFAAVAQGAPPSYWFAGTKLIFATAETHAGETAVATSDPGLRTFLARVGATLTYVPGQSYITVTTADRRVLALAIGDARLRSAKGSEALPFAPYLAGDDAFVPLLALVRALDVVPVPGTAPDDETVLQPQLAALDVRTDSGKTYVVVRGATELRPTVVVDGAERVTIAFTGVGSSLAPDRRIALPGLASARVVVTGSVRAPVTTVTFLAGANATHVVYPVAAPNERELGFAPRGLALDPLPPPRAIAAMQPPILPPAAQAVRGRRPQPAGDAPGPASAVVPTAPPEAASGLPAGSVPPTEGGVVTNVAILPTENGATIAVTLTGNVAFDWHRLSDNRFYIDLHGATLGDAGRDEKPNLPALESVRIRQIGSAGAPVVRVALTLAGDKRVDVQPNDGGFSLLVGASDATEVARSGSGRIGGSDPNPVALAPSAAAAPSPPAAFTSPLASPAPWKFGGLPSPEPLALPPPGSNPRLIVIDPGHGGSDVGTQHNGLMEKTLTLDIANRLRALLTAQGWIVKMTRTADVDVYGPNASDVNELQARVNVANYNAARLFISIHVNYYTDPATHGTTTYYTKDMDKALARAVQHGAVDAAGSFDDGIRHGHLYVTNHTTMPAVLVETGFISNPEDVAHFRSPAWLQAIAQGIASGVKEYAGKPPRAAVSAATPDPGL